MRHFKPYLFFPVLFLCLFFHFAATIAPIAQSADDQSAQVSIKASADRIGMGRSVCVDAQVLSADGKPAANRLLLPYINGKRWGSHEITDNAGKATFLLPLPNPGIAEIVVEILPSALNSITQFYFPNPAPNEKLMAGYRLPEGAAVSNTLQVRVDWRKLAVIPEDPEHLIGMQWEPWFTPQAVNWTTAQAVPVMGLYWSYNPDVLRQQMIWLIESGVNFLVADWTNHIFDKKHWDERDGGPNTIIHATTLGLEMLAVLRDEGQYVPKMVLYPGICNGPETTSAAINEELEWIYHTYVNNPRFSGLFVNYLGKPLVMIHNGAGPGWFKAKNEQPLQNEHFTIRWQSSQNQTGKLHEQGYWSWMDGSLEPMLTMFEGKPEMLTVSAAFFASGGWKAPTAYGHRGGWTYVESFKAALKHKPRFIELHQFNEFAGQPEGSGYGEKKDGYYDSYSMELSDDIEPVSLTASGYRSQGGWGYFYLNLTRALMDLYRQKSPSATVIAIDTPLRGAVVQDTVLPVSWTWVGKEPRGYRFLINGEEIKADITGNSAKIDISRFANGFLKLRLTAEGAESRYPLSYTEDSLPLQTPVPASVDVEFTLNKTENPVKK